MKSTLPGLAHIWGPMLMFGWQLAVQHISQWASVQWMIFPTHMPVFQTSTVWYIFENVPLKTFYPFDQCHVLDMSPDIIMVAHSRELECRPRWSDGGWWMRETALLDICLREAIILQKFSFFLTFLTEPQSFCPHETKQLFIIAML